MLKRPVAIMLQFRSFAPNFLPQTPQNFTGVFSVNSLRLRDEFRAHNSANVKLLACAPDLTCLLWSLRPQALLLQRLLLCLSYRSGRRDNYRHWWWSLTWSLGHPSPRDRDPLRLQYDIASAHGQDITNMHRPVVTKTCNLGADID